MTGEEMSGPPAQKVYRLLSFAAAGVICTFAINQWREFESKRAEQNEEKEKQQQQLPHDSQSTVAQKVLK